MKTQVATVTDRFAGIPAEYVSEAFRAAVLKVDGVHRNHADAMRKASDGAAAAAAAGDVAAEASARGLLRELETLHLPSLEWRVVDAELALAASLITTAEQHVSDPPPPLFLYELAAYESLPVEMRAGARRAWYSGEIVIRPMPGPTDVRAWDAAKALIASRPRLLNMIAAWRAAREGIGIDCQRVIDQVRAAVGCVELAREYEAHYSDVVELVQRADEEHRRLGLSWKPPSGFSSPAIEALAQRS